MALLNTANKFSGVCSYRESDKSAEKKILKSWPKLKIRYRIQGSAENESADRKTIRRQKKSQKSLTGDQKPV